MRVLLDTNVLLDVLLAREPHATASARVLAMAEQGTLAGFVSATSVTTIAYLAGKAVGERRARRHLETLLSLLAVAPVDETVLRGALQSGFADFEDAVIHEAAQGSGCQGIVTRDAQGFRRSRLPVYAPIELLALVATQSAAE